MPICLSSLPNELVSIICGLLPNRDIKNLRLVCSHLGAVARLRLDRVFLSANPRNVDVFNAIAAHDVFRNQIVEIVWDCPHLDHALAVVHRQTFYLCSPATILDHLRGTRLIL